MKKVIIIVLIVRGFGIVGTVMGQAADAKPYIVKGDTLFAHKDYRNAQEQYRMAYQFDRGNRYPKMMMDSINRMDDRTKQDKWKADDTNRNIARLKEAGLKDIIFGDDGKPVKYVNKNGEVKDVSDLANASAGNAKESYKVIMSISKKDWEMYK